MTYGEDSIQLVLRPVALIKLFIYLSAVMGHCKTRTRHNCNWHNHK